jgi:hypothetical protein
LDDVDQLCYLEQLLRDTKSDVAKFLETMAALKSNLVPSTHGKDPQALDTANLLGWTTIRQESNNLQLNGGVALLEEKKRRRGLTPA